MVDSCDDISVSFDTIQFIFVPSLAILNISFCLGTPCMTHIPHHRTCADLCALLDYLLIIPLNQKSHMLLYLCFCLRRMIFQIFLAIRNLIKLYEPYLYYWLKMLTIISQCIILFRLSFKRLSFNFFAIKENLHSLTKFLLNINDF